MAPPSAKLASHIKDPALEKILNDNGLKEFITQGHNIRIRKIVNASINKEPIPDVVIRYIAKKRKRYLENEFVADVSREPPYKLQKLDEVPASSYTAHIIAGDPVQDIDLSSDAESRRINDEVFAAMPAEGTTFDGQPIGTDEASIAADRLARAQAIKEAIVEKMAETARRNREEEARRARNSRNPPDTGGRTDGNDNRDPDPRRRANEETPETGGGFATFGDDPKNYAARRAKKPKFTLEAIHSTGYDLQEYDANHRPIAPAVTQPLDDDGNEIDFNQPLPDEMLTDDLIEAIDIIMEVNGKPCYDAEALALGALKESEFFLMPTCCERAVIQPTQILQGRNAFAPRAYDIAQVYAVAKVQAASLGYDEANQLLWALIRCQTYAAGWYDRQRYSRFTKPVKGALKLFSKDFKGRKEEVTKAYQLAAFMPFFHEMTFRAQCATWSETRSNEFVAKAKSLMAAAGLPNLWELGDEKLIFGPAYRWVGIERVKEVLRADEDKGSVPNIFKLRAKSSPAGKAFICNTSTVLNTIDTQGWWVHIERETGCKRDVIDKVAHEAWKNPFRYHMMSGAYNETKLNASESDDVEAATRDSIKLAPITQAYVATYYEGKNLANNKTISRYVETGAALYQKYLLFFRNQRNKKAQHLSEVNSKAAFEPMPIKPPAPRRRQQEPIVQHPDDEEENQLVVQS